MLGVGRVLIVRSGALRMDVIMGDRHSDGFTTETA